MAFPASSAIKCIFSDVDGTLLNSDHSLPPRNIAAIRKLRRKHPQIPFIICSGKAYESCLDIRNALELPKDMLAVHCGGALIHRGKDIIQRTTLTATTAIALVQEFKGIATFLFYESGLYYINAAQPQPSEQLRDWPAFCAKYDTGLVDASHEPARSQVLQQLQSGELCCIKITMCDEVQRIPAHKARLATFTKQNNHEVTITAAIPEIPEMMPPNVDKGRAVTHVCEILGIGADSVMAFGDGENDIPMLSTVGFSIAMANAMPKTAEIAKYHTLSNDEGGVGAFLERVFDL